MAAMRCVPVSLTGELLLGSVTSLATLMPWPRQTGDRAVKPRWIDVGKQEGWRQGTPNAHLRSARPPSCTEGVLGLATSNDVCGYVNVRIPGVVGPGPFLAGTESGLRRRVTVLRH